METLNNIPGNTNEQKNIKEEIKTLWEQGDHETAVEKIIQYFNNLSVEEKKKDLLDPYGFGIIDTFSNKAFTDYGEVELGKKIISVVSSDLSEEVINKFTQDALIHEKKGQLENAWTEYLKLGNVEKAEEMETRAKNEYGVPIQYVGWGWRYKESEHRMVFKANNFWWHLVIDKYEEEAKMGQGKDAEILRKEREIIENWKHENADLVAEGNKLSDLRDELIYSTKEEDIKKLRDAERALLDKLEPEYKKLANMGVRCRTLCG